MSTQEPESGTHPNLARRAQLNGFWGGIAAAVLSGVILAIISAVFPSLWESIWISRLPSGAIIAFDRDELKTDAPCPPGWHLYDRLQGRVIVGATGEAEYKYRKEGGHDSIKIAAANLPTIAGNFYALQVLAGYGNGGYPLVKVISSVDTGGESPISVTIANNNEEIPSMPLYRALFYCQKL
jgi:hypothetical protein